MAHYRSAHPSKHPSTAPLQQHGETSSSGSTIAEVICPRRMATLAAAVELQVDPEDLAFESVAERMVWEELQEEFRAFVAKIGPVWIAD